MNRLLQLEAEETSDIVAARAWQAAMSLAASVYELPSDLDASHFAFLVNRDRNAWFIAKPPQNPVTQWRNIRFVGIGFKNGKIHVDGLAFDRCIFDDVTLVYDGGPLYIADSYFRNCRFELARGRASRELLAQISEAGYGVRVNDGGPKLPPATPELLREFEKQGPQAQLRRHDTLWAEWGNGKP